jgi:hypothetical protein
MIYTIPTINNQHMYVEIIGFFKKGGSIAQIWIFQSFNNKLEVH